MIYEVDVMRSLASVFKIFFDIVGNQILHICNRSLTRGVFPNRLMLSLVIFILEFFLLLNLKL